MRKHKTDFAVGAFATPILCARPRQFSHDLLEEPNMVKAFSNSERQQIGGDNGRAIPLPIASAKGGQEHRTFAGGSEELGDRDHQPVGLILKEDREDDNDDRVTTGRQPQGDA